MALDWDRLASDLICLLWCFVFCFIYGLATWWWDSTFDTPSEGVGQDGETDGGDSFISAAMFQDME